MVKTAFSISASFNRFRDMYFIFSMKGNAKTTQLGNLLIFLKLLLNRNITSIQYSTKKIYIYFFTYGESITITLHFTVYYLFVLGRQLRNCVFKLARTLTTDWHLPFIFDNQPFRISSRTAMITSHILIFQVPPANAHVSVTSSASGVTCLRTKSFGVLHSQESNVTRCEFSIKLYSLKEKQLCIVPEGLVALESSMHVDRRHSRMNRSFAHFYR